MSRTLADIEAEIQVVKDANPGWMTNHGVMAFIVELLREQNSCTVIAASAGKSPSNIVSIQYYNLNSVLKS